MPTLDDIPQTYDEAVELLARWHAEDAPDDLVIYALPDPDQHVVQLLEISDSFWPLGKVAAFRFGRSEEFPFESAVAQINHSEWKEVQRGALALPDGWDTPAMRQVWP